MFSCVFKLFFGENYIMKFKNLVVSILSLLLMTSCSFDDIKYMGKEFNSEYSYNEKYHYRYCLDCDEYAVRDKGEHEYEDTVVAPSYFSKGYTEHKCKVCGYSYEDNEVEELPLTATFVDYYGNEVYSANARYSYNRFYGYINEAISKIDKYIIVDGKVRDFLGFDSMPKQIEEATVFKAVYSEPRDYSIVYDWKYNLFCEDWWPRSICGIKNVLNKDYLDVVLEGSFTDGYNSQNIYNNAFKNDNNIRSVKISKDITKICASAFYDCENLESVSFEEGSNLKTIDYYGFYKCTSLKEISLPDTLSSIGSHCFQGCSSLESVKLPDGLKCVEYCAFKDCSSLKYIEIPDSVKELSSGAFVRCTSLEYIKTPLNLGYIADYCFYECSSLKSIYLPESFGQGGYHIFEGTSNLTVYCYSSQSQYFWAIDSWAFDSELNVVYNCTDRDKYNPYYVG